MGSTGRPGWREDGNDGYAAGGDETMYPDQMHGPPVPKGGQVKVLMQGVQQAHSRIQQLQEENRLLRARLASLETPGPPGRPSSAGPRPQSSGGRPQANGRPQPGVPLSSSMRQPNGRPQPGTDVARSNSGSSAQSFRTKKAEDEAKEWKAMYVDALKKLRDAHQELTMQQGKSEQLHEQIRSLQDMSETGSAPSPHPPATPTPEHSLALSPSRSSINQRPSSAHAQMQQIHHTQSMSAAPYSAYPPLAPPKSISGPARPQAYAHDPTALSALPVSAYAHQQSRNQGNGMNGMTLHGSFQSTPKMSIEIQSEHGGDSPMVYGLAPRMTQDDLALEKRPPPVRTSRNVPKTYTSRMKDKPKWVQSLLSCVSNSEVNQPRQ